MNGRMLLKGPNPAGSSGMRWTAWLVLAATLLLWSGNWIVARAVREDIAPGIATVGRILIVLAILLPFAFPELRRKLGTLTRHVCPESGTHQALARQEIVLIRA